MKTITTNRIVIRKLISIYLISFPERLVSRSKTLPRFIRTPHIDIIQTGHKATEKTFHVVISKNNMSRPDFTIRVKNIDIDKEIKLKNAIVQKHEYGFRAEWNEKIGNVMSLSISSIININQPWRTV